MNILCVIDSLGSGGAQRQMVELAIGLKKKMNEVSLLIYHPLLFYKEQLDSAGIKTHIITEPKIFKRFLQIRKFIRRGNYHCVISFLDSPNLICELSGFPYRKWKLIVSERSANPAILKSVRAKLVRLFHVFADHIVANSYENIKILKKANPLLPRKKCHVIYNMVDFEKWKPTSSYIPLQNGKFKLVVVASHQKLKNLNGLVEAINLMSKELRDRLVIDWYGESVTNAKYNDNDAINKINYYKLNDIFNLYAETNSITKAIQLADAVGLFSFYEGFPNVICEAMASSKPILVSNILDSSFLEQIDKGCIFDPHKNQEILNSIMHLMNVSLEELMNIGKHNLNLSKELFHKEKIISAYLGLTK